MAKLFVITGPSGVGKGTLLTRLLTVFPNLEYSISTTTRKPRAGEVDGVNYFFVDELTFKKSADNNEFLEWAKYSGNFYGTSRKFVNKALLQGKNIILEIETQGAMQILNSEKNSVGIFILPPSLKELEKRLRGRNTESEEAIQRRLKVVKDEIALKGKYKYNVVNGDLDEAFEDLKVIFKKELEC